MASVASARTTRPPRSDALRNRERLLDAARVLFAETDGRDSPSLDAIARRAGVGIGTLYRHFPTRDELVAALYRAELDAVCDAADGLVAAHPAVEALREWMRVYAGFVAAKRGMADSLRPLLATDRSPGGDTRDRVSEAIGRILAAGVAEGSIRTDARGADVAAALVGVFLVTGLGVTAPADRAPDVAASERMMHTLVEGLRTRPG